MTVRQKRWVASAAGLGLASMVLANVLVFPDGFQADVQFKWDSKSGFSEIYVFPPGGDVSPFMRISGAVIAMESRPLVSAYMRRTGWHVGEGQLPITLLVAFPPIVGGIFRYGEPVLIDPTETLLMKACDRGDLESVRALLASGADVNAHDQRGWTPLMHASMSPEGTAPVLQALLEAGAEVNAKDTAGRTALIWAAARPGWGGDGKLRVLLRAHADPNARSSFGETPLERLMGNTGAVDLAAQLLAVGADPNTKTLDGTSVLAIAQQDGNARMARLLSQAGARE